MPGGYEISFRIGGYAWKMNGNECGVTYFTLHTPRNLRHQVLDLKMKKPTLLSKAACWPSIWPASCLGIIANVSEKINTGFENHKQPHSTTGNLIKKNWKRCDALLLGARPSPRLPLICGNHEDFA